MRAYSPNTRVEKDVPLVILQGKGHDGTKYNLRCEAGVHDYGATRRNYSDGV